MSRTLGVDLSLIHRLRSAEAVYLLELEFSGGTTYFTTASQDILWNGHTYQALGGNMQIEPVAETTDDRSQGVGIKASGVDQTLLALLLSNQTKGRYATVYLAHLHRTGNMSDNPELLTVINGWGALNGVTVARDTGVKPVGAVASCKVTWNAATSPWGVTPLLKSGGRYPVVAGTNYTFSIDANGDSVAGAPSSATFQLMVQWFDGASAVISSPAVNFTRLPGWNRYSVTLQAPAGAVTSRPRIHVNGFASGDIFYASNAKFEPGAIATEYQPGWDSAYVAGTVVLDPIIVFKGFMNESFQIEEERDDQGNDIGTVTISTRLTSRMAVMAKVRGIRTNLESHQALFPGDTFFKFVPTLQGKKIKWGG